MFLANASCLVPSLYHTLLFSPKSQRIRLDYVVTQQHTPKKTCKTPSFNKLASNFRFCVMCIVRVTWMKTLHKYINSFYRICLYLTLTSYFPYCRSLYMKPLHRRTAIFSTVRRFEKWLRVWFDFGSLMHVAYTQIQSLWLFNSVFLCTILPYHIRCVAFRSCSLDEKAI